MTNIKDRKFYSIVKSIMSYALQIEPPVEIKSPWFYANQYGSYWKR